MLSIWALFQLLLQWSWMAPSELFGEGLLLSDRALDLVTVVPVVGQRGVDIGERYSRVVVDNLVW